jgi:hypothetical protein
MRFFSDRFSAAFSSALPLDMRHGSALPLSRSYGLGSAPGSGFAPTLLAFETT